MGNQTSSRRVSFENDEPESVVKVSEKVVELLKQSTDGDKIPPKQQFKSVPASNVKVPTPILVNESCYGDFSEDLEKRYEEELMKNNQYWEARIRDLQERHEQINKTWEIEYKKAFEDVETLFGKVPAKGGKTPCSTEKSNLLNCYKKNSGQPLMCFNEVQAFSDCMNGGGKK